MIQVKQDRAKNRRGLYIRVLFSSLSFLLTVLLVMAIVYFWEDIGHAKAYGYSGGFLISILGGVTVIPVPSLLVIFTLGHRLNPAYVGLISGLGEALGGITTYLTGTGVETVLSRVRSRQQSCEHEPGHRYDIVRPVQSRFWSKGEVFYNHLANWIGGRRGPWIVFIAAAIPISPFYFAGIAAGSLKMGLLRFFLISWAGKTIRGLIIAFAGYGGLYLLLRWIGM